MTSTPSSSLTVALRLGSMALPLLALLCGTIDAAPIPKDLQATHVLNRLAFGPSQGDVQRVEEMGVANYISQQLHPESIPIPQDLSSVLAGFDTLRLTPPELFAQYGRAPGVNKKANPEAAAEQRRRERVVLEQGMAARLYRSVESPRQLQEVMVEFWFNHFNVFAHKGLDRIWVASFEQEAIRPHTMGRFRDLLEATAKHPAMLFYLDNWLNTAPGSPGAKNKFGGLNENYARELMELHTLGVNGGYTQKDVTALARILTGWGLAPRRGLRGGPGWWRLMASPEGGPLSTPGFAFDPRRHDWGDKLFLGHLIKASGMAEIEQALDLLARSPATAHHISYELAQYFVADNPPDSLVRRLTQTYLRTDGNIRAVLQSLFSSPEFWDQRYYQVKFKTPYEYVVSSLRATGLEPRNFRPLLGELRQLGMPLYGCLTPDGYKNTQDAWLNPDAMMQRLSFATALGSGRLPLNRPVFSAPEQRALATASFDEAHNSAPLAPDFNELALTLGNRFSHRTAQAVREAPEPLRASLILASPEFMRR